ncbi:glutathione S-transferase [Paracoccaceae bacterium GXU_MW_L88]
MMRLYWSPASPFARLAWVACLEAGQEDKVERVSVMGHPTDIGNLPINQNPIGKIPALERYDGPSLYDSRVICQYFDEISGGKLYPTGPRRFDALTLEATAHGMLDAGVLRVYEHRSRPEAYQWEGWREAQWDKVARGFDALEERWMGVLNGPVTMGSLAVAITCDWMDFRHNDKDWRTGHAQLATWHEKMKLRGTLRDTMPVAA